jgi:hypothetical protein
VHAGPLLLAHVQPRLLLQPLIIKGRQGAPDRLGLGAQMGQPGLAVVLMEQQEVMRWKAVQGQRPYQLIRGCCGRQLQLVDTYCQLFRATCSLLDDWQKVLGFGRAWETCQRQRQQQQQQQQQQVVGALPAWYSHLQDLLPTTLQPAGLWAQEAEKLAAAGRSAQQGLSKGAGRAKKAGGKQRSSGGAPPEAAASQGEQRAASGYYGLPAEDVLLLASLAQLLRAVSESLKALSSRLEVDVAWLMNEEVGGACM